MAGAAVAAAPPNIAAAVIAQAITAVRRPDRSTKKPLDYNERPAGAALRKSTNCGISPGRKIPAWQWG
jgi:hypothetical protein